MLIFHSIQKNMAIIGIDRHKSALRHGFNEHNVLVAGVLGAACISSSLYLLFEKPSIKEYIISVYATADTIACGTNFVILAWKSSKVFQFIQGLQNIIKMRKHHPESMAKYAKSNQQIEIFSDAIHSITVTIVLPSIMLPKFFFSFFTYFFTASLGSDCFDLPFPAYMPFRVNTPVAYLTAFIAECVAIVCMGYVVVVITSLACGSFLLSLTLISDIKCTLDEVNENSDQVDIMKKLANFMDFGSMGKQLIMDFSDIYQPFIFFLFFSDLFGICGAMLLLQMGIEEGNMVLLLMSLSLLWWALILTYFPCELGERLSNAMEEIKDSIGQFNWYLFPIEIRKVLPTILIGVQQPVEIRFFGSISCNRESFKKIINCTFSYFMVLREFAV